MGLSISDCSLYFSLIANMLIHMANGEESLIFLNTKRCIEYLLFMVVLCT